MADLIEALDVEAIGIDRLRQQYKESNIIPVFQGYATEAQYIENAFVDIINSRAIDNAIGVQLDFIGEIVGQPRELIDAANVPYFGFEGFPGSKEFGSVADPSKGGVLKSRLESSTTVRILTDVEYRTFIRAKIKSNHTDCSPDDIAEIINFIFDTSYCYIEENPNSDAASYIVYISKQLSESDLLLLSSGIIPKPNGVTVSYSGNSIIDPNNPLMYSSSYVLAAVMNETYSNGELIPTFIDSTLNSNDGIQADTIKQPTFIKNAFEILEAEEEAVALGFSTDNANSTNVFVSGDEGYEAYTIVETSGDMAMVNTEATLDLTQGISGAFPAELPPVEECIFKGVYFKLDYNNFPANAVDFTHVIGMSEATATSDDSTIIQNILVASMIFTRETEGNGARTFILSTMSNEPVSASLESSCGFKAEVFEDDILYFGVDPYGRMVIYKTNIAEPFYTTTNEFLYDRMSEVVQLNYLVTDLDNSEIDRTAHNSTITIVENPVIEFSNFTQLKNFDAKSTTYYENIELLDIGLLTTGVGYNTGKNVSLAVGYPAIYGSENSDLWNVDKNYGLYFSLDTNGANEGNTYGAGFFNGDVTTVTEAFGVLVTFNESTGKITNITLGELLVPDVATAVVDIAYVSGEIICVTLNPSGEMECFINGAHDSIPTLIHTLTAPTLTDLQEVGTVIIDMGTSPTNTITLVNNPPVEYDNAIRYQRARTVMGASILGYRPAARFYADDEMPLTVSGQPENVLIFLRGSFNNESSQVLRLFQAGSNGDVRLDDQGDNLNIKFTGAGVTTSWSLETASDDMYSGDSYEIALVFAVNEADKVNSWAQLWANNLKVDSVSNVDFSIPFDIMADSPLTIYDDVHDLEAIDVHVFDELDFGTEDALDEFIKTNWLAFQQN